MKIRKSLKKALSFTFSLIVTAGVISNNSAALLNKKQMTAAAAETDDKAERTIMLYLCGASLESGGACGTYNLHQILSSDFGKSGDVNFIVMTGDSNKWYTESEHLYAPSTGTSPETISNEYNQIWEAKSISDKDNPGQLVLLDGDGISSDGENAKRSEVEPMTSPETLKAFINYAAENYPAEKYDLILWDHGYGPNSGYGSEEHLGKASKPISFAGLADAFSDNAVTRNGGKFDFIDFDACLMSSLDLALVFADYTDYYIASPELEPGYGQRYDGWLNAVREDPGIDTYELGKIIVDVMMDFYESEDSDGYGQNATLSVIDTKNSSKAIL